MPATLSFGLNFVHPLMMWSLLAAGGYAMYLGIKAKKVRTGTAEQRKALLPGKFAQRHYLWGSALLAFMVFGTIGGMAVTYLNNGKLFVGPHLLVGLAMTAMIAGRRCVVPIDATRQPDCPQGSRRSEHGHAHLVSLAGRQRHGDSQPHLGKPLIQCICGAFQCRNPFRR